MSQDAGTSSRTPRSTPPRRGAAQREQAWRDQLESYLAHHRKTARDSARRLLRNPFATFSTWLVMGIAMALPVALLLLLASLQSLGKGWDDAARINVYLDTNTSETDALDLRRQIQQLPAVAQVEFISRASALEIFRERSGVGDALDYLNENPLPHTLIISPVAGQQTPAALATVKVELAAMRGVELVQLDLAWLQRLQAITDLMWHGVLALGLILALAVVLIIGNTIRLSIESRKDEILVTRLVGGTDGFVRRPFLYTGVWYGLGGAVMALLLIGLAMLWLDAPVKALTALYGSDFSLQGLPFGGGFLVLLTGGVFGWLGAWLSVWQHLGAIEPG